MLWILYSQFVLFFLVPECIFSINSGFIYSSSYLNIFLWFFSRIHLNYQWQSCLEYLQFSFPNIYLKWSLLRNLVIADLSKQHFSIWILDVKCHCHLFAWYITLCTIHSQNVHSVIFLKAAVVVFTDLFCTSGCHITSPYP